MPQSAYNGSTANRLTIVAPWRAKMSNEKHMPVNKVFAVPYTVHFASEAEAEFYESAFARGDMQAIYSEYLGEPDYEHGHRIAFVFAPGAKQFSRETELGVSRSFSHSGYVWDDWLDFAQFFGPGVKFCEQFDNIWLEWKGEAGKDWVDCESPYDCHVNNQ